MMTLDRFNAALDAVSSLADQVEKRRDDLAEAGALDAGFPVKVTFTELDMAVNHLRSMEEEWDWVRDRAPFGMVAAILPYDAAVVFLARLGGASLISGNELRFSFSSWTPRTARLIAEITERTKGLQAVLKMDNRDFGSRCVRDASVRVLFISGSSQVGEVYRKQHEAFDKLFFAGPGGMPAALVLEDADPQAAVRFIVRRAFLNGGQYCTTLKKVLIHRSHYNEVRRGILEETARLKVGDPLDADTDIGPIRVERTLQILTNAVASCEGARCLAGGRDGTTVHPIIVEMESIPDLELFGPFLALQSFQDPGPALEELARSRYGFLVAAFGSLKPEQRAMLQENFGMVFENPDFFFTNLRSPFGGRKASGWILERNGTDWIRRDGAFIYSKELTRNPLKSAGET